MKRRLFSALAVAVLGALPAQGHIGTLNVVYESLVPPVPMRVIIRPPGVVPGLADIDVRVLTNGVQRVSVLPVHSRAGLKGSPPPDVAKPVEGEPNLYHAQLWLMTAGAYSVHVSVETANGTAKVMVPVNSLATSRLPMTTGLGSILVALGVLLFGLAVSIVGAAARESALSPGQAPSAAKLLAGRVGLVVASIALAFALAGGRAWWNFTDRNHRNNRMYQPVECAAEVRLLNGQRVLALTIHTNDSRSVWTQLVPDHGKLMHVFMMREPALDVLAHLHPVRRSHWSFEAVLPPLPEGKYRLYADVTHESGFSQTLTALAKVPALGSGPAGTAAAPPADPDDSWHQGTATAPSGTAADSELGDGLMMKWVNDGPLVAGREISLRFAVVHADGRLARLEPYMSMLGHAAIRRDDGAVFTHLHPAGSISVASQQVFQLRTGENAPRRITPEMMERLCQSPAGDLANVPLAFPYEFPKPGRYHIWVQVKIDGKVRTGEFAAEVRPAS